MSGRDAGASLILDPKTVTPAHVGRSEASALRLTDPLVSRRHAAFEFVRGQLRLRDLDSSDGTFVNGVRVREAYLAGEETLRLGDTSIHVRVAVARVASPLSSASSFGRVLG